MFIIHFKLLTFTLARATSQTTAAVTVTASSLHAQIIRHENTDFDILIG
jgi:hypothetical protein